MENISHINFILNGFSEFGTLRPLLFIPFFIMFGLSLSANSLLLYAVISQRSLHSPMYILISSMACVDISLPLFFIPNMLLNFLFDWRGISLLGCLVQMHFLHFVGTFQSTVLVWMAATLPFVLLCTITNSCQNVLMITLIVSLTGTLSFCASNVINHCFCEHMALVELACGNTAINNLVGLLTVCLTVVVDFILSLPLISSFKAFHTCITHIVVMSFTLILALTVFLSYRIRNHLPASSRVLFSTMYLLFPSCLNPIIYGIRTKEIRQQILKTLTGCCQTAVVLRT
ncbi:hypothetical protein Q5P01_009486 [Channa striata]|uniref:G-protein coupled receptors family 1 profile domain-containing protein n=1 Tax=Channa striata TaxID=64152 RepID=A0AA88MXQ5_CHASR|nr:hypothetical protein Q5P01_009486 [Channa striata]